jgi:single-stranded DNA-binding protein
MFVQLQAVGRVEADPKLVVTPVGTPVTEFPLAITTKRCLEDLTIRLTCWAWGEQAKTMIQCVTKGTMLFVQGPFTLHQDMTEGGKQGVNLEVTVETFSFADESKPDGNSQQSLTMLDGLFLSCDC